MDDSTTSNANTNDDKIPLGLGSFNEEDRKQFGQNIRLAMSCIEGSAPPVKADAMPSDEAEIRQRLKALSQDMNSCKADLLELLVRFDDLKGWKSGGACHCAAWMNFEIGISMQLGWEYLRVDRKLRSLPVTTALFRAGKLSWSKIRLIVNVADKDNEKTLCHASLDASVTGVKTLCEGYRWQENANEEDQGETENLKALKQWESRFLYWNEASNGNTHIRLSLPPDLAQAFLNSVEHSVNQLEDSESKISQRRADAAVLMAESSLQSAGREIATADRYQVIVSVDESALNVKDDKTGNVESQSASADNDIPKKRPTVKGAGPIARETARRIACDCSVSVHTTSHGEPVDIGRKSRIWPNAMARAIKDRDQHCQWPGCSHSQNLHIHHVEHWADGGTTCVSNAASLCSYHHHLVHEGGYVIQHVDSSEHRLDEQFAQQQRENDSSMFNFEKELRDDRASFNEVRKLSPSNYRFRVIDADGIDIIVKNHIHEIYGVEINNNKNNNNNKIDESHSTTVYDNPDKSHSTRVECGEPVTEYFYQPVKHKQCLSKRTKGAEFYKTEVANHVPWGEMTDWVNYQASSHKQAAPVH